MTNYLFFLSHVYGGVSAGCLSFFFLLGLENDK